MEDSLTSDDWIRSNSAIEFPKLHALGVITLRWNSCETAIFVIFTLVFGLKARTARILSHDLGMPAVCERIKNQVEYITLEEKAKQAILHGIRLFNTNKDNRNLFVHSQLGASKDGYELWRSKGPRFDPKILDSELSDIRRVADDIKTLSDFLVSVANYMSANFYNAPLPELQAFPPLPKPIGQRSKSSRR